MSCVVKTVTPFIDKDILCEALKEVGCKCTVQGERIVTDIRDLSIGFQTFERDKNGKYVLMAYSYTDKNRAEFIQKIETHYNALYQKRLEEIAEAERIRLEEERKAYVEKQKASITAKAKELGYSVKEKKVENKIKLVLVRYS